MPAKRLWSGILTIALTAFVFASSARATAINGVVGFGGLFAADASSWNWTTATEFHFIEALGQRSGDFAVLSPFVNWWLPAGQLHISDTSYPQYFGQGDNLTQYYFDITSISFTITPNSFLAQGSAIAYMTGFDPTYATWSITGAPRTGVFPLYQAGATFTASGVRVSEGGMPGVWVLAAVVALVALRSRRFTSVRT